MPYGIIQNSRRYLARTLEASRVKRFHCHYNDVIMSTVASQSTSLTIVLFRRRSKKASKLRVTGLCEGNSPETGEFPAQKASNAEMLPFDDVTMVFTVYYWRSSRKSSRDQSGMRPANERRRYIVYYGLYIMSFWPCYCFDYIHWLLLFCWRTWKLCSLYIDRK